MLLKERSSKSKKGGGGTQRQREENLIEIMWVWSAVTHCLLRFGSGKRPPQWPFLSQPGCQTEAPWTGGRSRNRNSMTELSFDFMSVDGAWVQHSW